MLSIFDTRRSIGTLNNKQSTFNTQVVCTLLIHTGVTSVKEDIHTTNKDLSADPVATAGSKLPTFADLLAIRN